MGIRVIENRVEVQKVKVITAGGIYGIIKDVQETTFLIEVSKDVTIKVDKGSVYVSAEEAQQAPKDNK